MLTKETEIKFRVENENEIIGRMEALGAEKTKEGLEHNEVFDNGDIGEKGILLRLRSFGGNNILTFKNGITKGEFKEADEIETGINDFQGAKKILENLGFGVSWIYEKETSRFLLDGTKISIDRLPFGTYMEIEGEESGIRNIIKRLGLDPQKGITETYFELYENFCKERGKEMENLVFWKRAR